MRSRMLLCGLLAGALGATQASATVMLIGTGELTGSAAGSYADLSGLTGTLENGAPANLLGGIGSGLAYAGGNTFLALPDRGPNAVTFNPDVDNTVSYIDRFHTVTMTLAPSGGSLPFTVNATLNKTTLLSSSTPLVYGNGSAYGLPNGAPAQNTADTYYFTGRSDNFDPAANSGNPANARLDPESIRVSPDGKSVFISDEYGPYIYQFDRATGQRIKSFALPSNLDVSTLAPVGQTEIDNNLSGRVANKGMEGLALTPDGKTLVGIMQAPLIQDAADPATKKLLRIVTVDIASGKTHEYGYMLTSGSGVSDIVAINDHEFLVDERDGTGLGDGSAAQVKDIFKIDISGATDITNLTGSAAAAAAVGKSKFLDLVAALTGYGLDATEIPSKIEGLAFGQDVLLSGMLEHTLWIANDNDFLADVAGANQFYVFGFTDADLPGFVKENFVPEPATAAVLGGALFGLFGFGMRRRRASLT